MALRSFSGQPRYLNTFNVTIPNIVANQTGEVGVAATVHNVGAIGGPASAEMYLAAHPATAGASPAVAMPAGMSFSHAYYNATDSKIYFRFSNPTVGNYTGADVVTMHVIGF